MTYRDLFDDESDFESMTMYDYEEAAMNLAFYEHPLVYPALGLVGEAGEVADKVKKLYRDGHLSLGGDPILELNVDIRVEIAKELGDVMFYVTAVASDLGFDLDEIATMNIEKLNSRKRRGRLRGSGDNR
jgi:NTP pyrophosphatase (non-canonical NTP hydrolase)